MDIDIFRGLMLAWCFIGFTIVIHEMRHEHNINLGWILAALLFSVLGPLWLLATLVRKTEKMIVFKKIENGNIEANIIDYKK